MKHTAQELLDKYNDKSITHKELEILYDCAFNRGQMLKNVVHMNWFRLELENYLKGE